MPKKILSVTLNPAIDKIITIKNFHLGQDFREEKIHLSAGGKGINVSRTLKHLGSLSIATGFLGGFAGRFITQELKKERMVSHFSPIHKESRTNLTIIDSKDKTITRVLERGPRISSYELKEFIHKYSLLLRNCDHVIFSGSIAPGLPESIFARLIQIAKQKGIKTALDTSGEPLILGLKAKPFLIKPNQEEAESVVGYRLNSISRFKRAIKYFHTIGVSAVIISLGERGVFASDGQTIFRAKTPLLKCQNNVGCGDALLSGFVYARKQGKNFKDAVRLAVSCGAANVTSLQPGWINKAFVKRLMAKVQIRQLNS